MTGFKDIVDLLDSLVVGRTVRKHGPFWRGKTRDDFVALRVFGLPVVDIGNPAGSNILLALKGQPPFGADLPDAPDTSVYSRMPSGGPAAGADVIAAVEAWIAAGCPEESPGAVLALGGAAAISDTDHVGFWRAFDDFFLYRATDEISDTVGTFMTTMTPAWKRFVHGTINEAAWDTIRRRADLADATRVIGDNHARLFREHYGDPFDADALLDSHWKFGGNLLPGDPLSSGPHQHTMNSPPDWVAWAPFIDTVLRDAPADPFNLLVARGWHVGIVADGLLRASPQRRIAIPDFAATDPQLKGNVIAHYQALDGPALRAALASRVLQSGII